MTWVTQVADAAPFSLADVYPVTTTDPIPAAGDEMRTAETVEYCRQVIEEKISAVFAAAKEELIPYTFDVLAGKEYFGREAFWRRILPSGRVDGVVRDIQDEVGGKLRECYGRLAPAVPAVEIDLDSVVHFDDLFGMVEQCRFSYRINATVAVVADGVWEQCLQWGELPGVAEECASGIALGTVYLEMAGCRPDEERLRCVETLALCFAGVLDSLCHRMIRQLHYNMAELFYQTYDRLTGMIFQEKNTVSGRRF